MNSGQDIDQLSINTMRTLVIDAIQKSNSGHPGTPLDAAPAAYTLWQRVLCYDRDEPDWFNRDRFVLSAGHASMLLYGLFHLAGIKATAQSYGERVGGPAVSLDDIKGFRQIGTRCPATLSMGGTSGVEATTGPLGQGVAMSVGMAMAQRYLAAHYNRPGFDLINYRVYALAGDGCMMEGISSEAASLAAHLKLSNLCWIYDRNRVTIEGHTDISFTEDVATRFLGYGWNVVRVGDANDVDQLTRAFQSAQGTLDRPTLIISESHIGYGSPHKQDTPEAHGEPLGVEEARLTKEFYGWDPDAQFLVPAGVMENFQAQLGRRRAEARAQWSVLFERYQEQYPDLGYEIEAMRAGNLPTGWDSDLTEFPADPKGLAARDVPGRVLNDLAKNIPWLIGGAADLSPSTKTRLKFDGAGDFQADSYSGRNLHFGIREHAMCAVANGMALSRVRPFVSGFFIFTDYCRAPIRLSALMETPVIYVWTHDSISVGEDGPTHEPIEHLASFRAMPGLPVFRPADANEVLEAYRLVMQQSNKPACLPSSRQALPTLDRASYGPAAGVAKGACVVADAVDGAPEVLLLASGSEVSLCVDAFETLSAEGIKARVVSMPSWDLFEEQDQAYRNSILPPRVTARVGVEEASPFGWDRYVGPTGAMLGMPTFGASAPAKVVQEYFGYTADHARDLAQAAREQLQQARTTR